MLCNIPKIYAPSGFEKNKNFFKYLLKSLKTCFFKKMFMGIFKVMHSMYVVEGAKLTAAQTDNLNPEVAYIL